MGSQFKTTTPQNVDFMYQLPENMMYKATQQMSQDITQNQAAVYDLYGKLPLNANPNDKERASQIIAGYEDKVDDLTQQLHANPLEFRKKAGEIIGLGREIHKDYTSGEAAGIADRYAGYVDYAKRQEEMVKAGKITDLNSVNLNLAQYLDEDKKRGMQWNPQTGSYNKFNPQDLLPTVDFQKKYSEFAKEIIPVETTTQTVGSNGKYIYTDKTTGKVRTEEDIARILNDRFALDFETQNFIKQRSSFGALQGWYTPKGEFITPDKEGSAYAKMLKINMEAFKINNIGIEHNMKVDSYGLPTQKAAAAASFVIDNNNVAEVKKVINLGPIDVANPITMPLAQLTKKKQDLSLENDGKLIKTAELLASLIPKDAFLKDETGRSKVGTELELLAQNHDTKGMKALAAKYGVQGSDVDDAVYQIESNIRSIATIEAQTDMYRKSAMAEIGYDKSTTWDDLSDDGKKIVNDNVNSMMVDGTISKPVVRTIHQTRGAVFTDDREKTIFDNGISKIKKDVLNGALPPQFIVSRTMPNGTVKVTQMTNQQFQDQVYADYKLKHQKATKKTYGTTMTGTTEGPEYGFKDDTKITVSKVLQPISADDGITYNKPYSVDYGDNLTIYLDASTVKAPEIEQLVASKNTEFEVENMIANLNAMARPGIISKENSQFVRKTETMTVPFLDDDIQYTTPETKDGVGYFTIKLDKPEKNPDGTLVNSVVLPANNKAALEEIYLHLNKR